MNNPGHESRYDPDLQKPMDAPRIPAQIPDDWWENAAGFFGSNAYMIGDNSVEGYIPGKPETLEQRTQREVDGVERILEMKPYASVVDCPCGYGRHSLELSNRWYDVVGVDINDEHLAAARAKLATLPDRPHPQYPGFAKRPNPVHFLKRDMRTLCEGLYTTFDYVINMFYSFGFFADEADNVRVMHEFHKALKDGGKFLLHSDVAPEMFESNHYRMSETRHLPGGGKLLIEEIYDPKTKRIAGVWIIEKDGVQKTLTPYSVRLYDAQEIRMVARHVGFAKAAVFGGFDGQPFTPESKEMILVATK
jgi:SAM-dependent methyltransferase